jgi:hypothetical protein
MNGQVIQNLKGDEHYINEYPAFSIHILGQDINLITKTLRSIDGQKYPFVYVNIISKVKLPLDINYKNISVISFVDHFPESEITQYLSNASKKSECFYFSFIPEGIEYLPQAFFQVRNIIKRFVEVHWLIGTSVYKNGINVQLPVDIAKRRLNKSLYLEQIKQGNNSNIDPASCFFTKSLLDSLNPSDANLLSLENLWCNLIEYGEPFYSTFYCSYTTKRNIYIKSNSISEWFFKNNIPYLKYFFRQKVKFNPLIRFEHRTNSYYLSGY